MHKTIYLHTHIYIYRHTHIINKSHILIHLPSVSDHPQDPKPKRPASGLAPLISDLSESAPQFSKHKIEPFELFWFLLLDAGWWCGWTRLCSKETAVRSCCWSKRSCTYLERARIPARVSGAFDHIPLPRSSSRAAARRGEWQLNEKHAVGLAPVQISIRRGRNN